MGANFTYIPTWVRPQTPQYAVLITPTESFKKDYQLLDTGSILKYELTFEGVLDANRNLMLAHFNGVTGPFDSFVWTTVPSYLNAGTTMTVRYDERNGYDEDPKEASWRIKIVFEKAN